MKICIWCTKIFDLGGTKRVVTLVANELVKEQLNGKTIRKIIVVPNKLVNIVAN